MGFIHVIFEVIGIFAVLLIAVVLLYLAYDFLFGRDHGTQCERCSADYHYAACDGTRIGVWFWWHWTHRKSVCAKQRAAKAVHSS